MPKSRCRSFLLLIFTGFFMGVAAIAPGVSGGAIAVIFGLYQPITDAIATLFKDMQKKLAFLLPLGLGAAAGMLLFGRLIHHLFFRFAALTCAVFVGLIGGTFPSVIRTAAREGFRRRYLLAAVPCAAAVYWITTLNELQYTAIAAPSHWLMFLCGVILGLGSVLPGTSASFVLMALGLYQPMLATVVAWDIPRMLLLGLGFCATFILFARLMSQLYKIAYGWVSFAVLGMLVGSVLAVLPKPSSVVEGVCTSLLALAAAALSYLLLRIKS